MRVRPRILVDQSAKAAFENLDLPARDPVSRSGEYHCMVAMFALHAFIMARLLITLAILYANSRLLAGIAAP